VADLDSQTAVEVLDKGSGHALVSQVAREVLYLRPVTTTVGLSQCAVEVLHQNVPGLARSQGTIVW
jgi:hypothetical protein